MILRVLLLCDVRRLKIYAHHKRTWYIAHMQKRCVILRGMPGSGKSTFTRQLGEEAIVCSADHYFERSGEYVFNPSMLFLAHKICRNKFQAAVDAGAPLVVVDNTNIKYKDWKDYLTYALEHGYHVTVAEAQECDIDVLIARGAHNVPRQTYEKMLNDYKTFEIPYGLADRDRVEVVKF